MIEIIENCERCPYLFHPCFVSIQESGIYDLCFDLYTKKLRISAKRATKQRLHPPFLIYRKIRRVRAIIALFKLRYPGIHIEVKEYDQIKLSQL